MADDTEGTEGAETQAGTPEAPAAPPEPSTPTSLPTSGQGLVTIGGWLLIATWLFFGVILNEYWISWLPLLLGILAVLIPRSSSLVAEFASPAAAMKAVGLMIGILGAVNLVEDIRFASSQLDSFIEVLGALIGYAGFAAAFLGARSIKT